MELLVTGTIKLNAGDDSMLQLYEETHTRDQAILQIAQDLLGATGFVVEEAEEV
jgi:hypothetical protein